MYAEAQWTDRFRPALTSLSSGEEAWALFSEFALTTLLAMGARWGRGVRSRGSLPPIRPMRPPGRVLPGSHPVVLHTRLLSLARELFFRLVRLPVAAPADASTTLCTVRQFRRLARDLRFPFTEVDLTPEGTAHLCDRADEALQAAVKVRRLASLKRWRAPQALGPAQWPGGLPAPRATTPAAGSNHLAGPDGLPAFHPAVALEHAAQQWNQVFDVHQAGVPIDPLMRPIQHLLEQRALAPVTAEELRPSLT